DILFMSAISAKKTPETFYVKTHKKKIASTDGILFLKNDLISQSKDSESGCTKFKILKEEIIKTLAKDEVSLVEASFYENGELQHLLVGILPKNEHYHYFMFQSKQSDYLNYKPLVLESIRSLKLK